MTKKTIKAQIAYETEQIKYYTEDIYMMDACKCYMSKAEVEKQAEFHKNQLAMWQRMLKA